MLVDLVIQSTTHLDAHQVTRAEQSWHRHTDSEKSAQTQTNCIVLVQQRLVNSSKTWQAKLRRKRNEFELNWMNEFYQHAMCNECYLSFIAKPISFWIHQPKNIIKNSQSEMANIPPPLLAWRWKELRIWTWQLWTGTIAIACSTKCNLLNKPTKRMCWTLMEQNLSSEISS